VALLTAANVAASLIGLVTGPLQAQALGPDGRGSLAAVVTPVAVAGWLAYCGQGPFIAREVAAGLRTRESLTAAVTIAAAAGVVVALFAAPVAAALAGGSRTVEVMLTLGLALTPLTLASQVVYDVNLGLQRWGALAWMRAAPAALQLVVVVALFLTDRLTVASAALVAIGVNVLAALPGLRVLASLGLPRLRRGALRTAGTFGRQAWLVDLLTLTNGRLDQFLMIPFVPRAELGWYVVAVTIAQVAAVLTSGVTLYLGPRVSRGDEQLVPRVTRVLALVALAIAVGFAVLTPLAVRWLFGADFAPATLLAVVLLLAGVPLAVTTFLGTMLTAAGLPAVAARSQVISAVITAGGLAAVIGWLGALGAALVSVVASTASALYALHVARVRYELPGVRWLLVPSWADVRWLAHQVRGLLRRGAAPAPASAEEDGAPAAARPALAATVVVPTWRRPDDLRRCLRALARQTRPAAEVVVVVRDDDGESHAVLADPEHAALPLRAEPPREAGLLPAVDAGLRAASGDVVLVTDDDGEPHPDWVERVLAAFADPRVQAVGGRVVEVGPGAEQPPPGPARRVGALSWAGRVVGLHTAPSALHGAAVEHLQGCNMAFRAPAPRPEPALRGSGHFYEMGLCLDVGARGTVVYDDRIRVRHHLAARPEQATSEARSSEDEASVAAASFNLAFLLASRTPRGPQALVRRAHLVAVGQRRVWGVARTAAEVLRRPRRAAASLRQLRVALAAKREGWRAGTAARRTPGGRSRDPA
jgi:O-antigen/teichoic acid export membrane protein